MPAPRRPRRPRRPRAPRPTPPDWEPYDSADPAFVTALLAPRYVPLRLLGRGALACTWLARESATDREVAARVVHERIARDDTARAHIRRLARAELGIAHPNIVRTWAVASEGQQVPYAVCEVVDGTDLGALLEAGGALPLRRAVGIAHDIAAALAAAHARGIVNGNLRPSDVLVERTTGRAKIYEFDAPLFGESGILGDPAWAPPELLEDPGSGPRSAADLYALGVMLYTMLAGEPPFRGTALQQMRAKAAGAVLPVTERRPDTPRTVENLLGYLLAPDPAQRGTAEQARAELAFILPTL
jgi:serine/threonine-protein kinase